MEKRLFVQLNGNRKVMGILRGYDVSSPSSTPLISAPPPTFFSYPRQPHCSCTDTTRTQVFLNIVLDEAVEERPGGERVRIGMCVIRGNSVVMLEALERMGDDRRH